MGVGRPRVKMWMARTGNNERAAELGDTLHNGCFLGRGRRREEERRRGGEEKRRRGGCGIEPVASRVDFC